MSAPDIKVLMGADGVEQVLAAFRKVQKEVRETDKAAKSSTSGWGSLSKVTGEMSKGILPQLSVISAGPAAAAGAAIAGLAVGLGAAITKSIEFADAMNDMHDKTGIAVETLSQLAPVAELGGTSLDSLVTIFGKFSAKVAKGDEDVASLGLTTKDAAQAMIQISAKMEKAKTQTEKIAIAQKAYGKSWQEMMPILQVGPENLRSQMEKAAIVTTDMAEKSAKFKDTMTEVKAPLMDLGLELAQGILPFITDWAEGMKIILARTKELLGLNNRIEQSLVNVSDQGVQNALVNKRREIFAKTQEIKAMEAESGNNGFVKWEKVRLDQLVQEEQQIQAVIERRKEAAKVVPDGGPTTETKKTEAAKRIFDEALFDKQKRDASVALQKELLAQQSAVIEDFYATGKMEIEDYYDLKIQMIEESASIEKQASDEEIIALKAKKAAAKEVYDQKQIQLEIDKLLSAQTLAEVQLNGEVAAAERDRAKAIEERSKTQLETALKSQEELAKQQQQLKDSLEQGANQVLNKFLTDTIFNAKSASDAFAQFGMSVVSTMQQILTQMLVMQAVKAMFGSFGGMGPGGVMAGSVLPQLGLYAEGGIISGGTPGKDSVPIMTMPGEGVLRTSAMSRIGSGAFHDLNEGRAFVVRGRAMPRFADGGIVGGAGSAAIEGGFGEAGLTVGLADGLIEHTVERWARGPVARRIQVEQLSKAPKSANQALGRTK